MESRAICYKDLGECRLTGLHRRGKDLRSHSLKDDGGLKDEEPEKGAVDRIYRSRRSHYHLYV